MLAQTELNELSQKVEAISAKGITKKSINSYSILNVANYFYSGILQNVLVFTSGKKYFRFFTLTIQIYSWKSKEMSE